MLIYLCLVKTSNLQKVKFKGKLREKWNFKLGDLHLRVLSDSITLPIKEAALREKRGVSKL